MEALALYLVKVHLAMALLYAVYYLAVRNEIYFRLNRFVLLAILLLSFSLPLVPLTQPGTAISTDKRASGVFNHETANPIQGQEVGKLEDEMQLRRLSGVVTTLLAFYVCGVLFFVLKFFNQILNVRSLIRSSEKVADDTSYFLDPGHDVPAFSFFNSIVVNRQPLDDTQLSLVIAHERAHVRQMHSVDIMAAELASVILWGNPFVIAFKNAMRMNLEFLADQEVLAAGFDKKTYQWSIVAPYLMQNEYPLTNQYNSKPKQRIEKMNASRKTLFNLYRYAAIIPVLAFIYFWVVPFHANAFDKIYKMKLIGSHEYRDYLGYYEFERDKGSFIRIMMKDQTLVMNTLWNNKKIYFEKQHENSFINKGTSMSLTFPKNWQGAVQGLVAFGEDRWTKVQKYTPVIKKAGEGTVLIRSSSGGIQVMVYTIKPWSNVKHYDLTNAKSSP